jgi:hypothetical protein
MRLKLLALYALPLACALIPPATAQTKRASAKPFVVVESGKGFDQLQQAVDAIGDGRGTIRIAPGTYRQCAVQSAGRISYVAAEAGGAIFDQSICEDQAALILRGESARIDGAIFQNYRGEAGQPYHAIAWQSGSLSVVNSLFRASDGAIISGDEAGSTLTISQSSFADAGLHIGRAAKFRMTTTTLANAALRAEAVRVEWDDNIFEDAEITTASMIALPKGGTGRIEHNQFRPHAARPSDAPLISVALEGRGPMARSLVVKDNHAAFAQGASGHALFVGDGSADGVSVGANELGTGITAYQRR